MTVDTKGSYRPSADGLRGQGERKGEAGVDANVDADVDADVDANDRTDACVSCMGHVEHAMIPLYVEGKILYIDGTRLRVCCTVE